MRDRVVDSYGARLVGETRADVVEWLCVCANFKLRREGFGLFDGPRLGSKRGVKNGILSSQKKSPRLAPKTGGIADVGRIGDDQGLQSRRCHPGTNAVEAGGHFVE